VNGTPARMTGSTIECPKCGTPAPDGSSECPRCGVVFARLREPVAVGGPDTVPRPGERLPHAAAKEAWGGARLARAAALAGLAAWTWQFARAPMGVAASESILHLPNLVFHEAGHVLFGFLGQFLAVAGGSLFQFALPLVLAGVFLGQSDQFGAAVCTWWAGQNLLDLAPYIADARALQLPLIGGRTGAEVEGHDWEYLLTELGWLHLDRTLGLRAHRLGLAIMAGALIWGAICLARNRDDAPGPADL
jgi:hypothetical protein